MRYCVTERDRKDFVIADTTFCPMGIIRDHCSVKACDKRYCQTIKFCCTKNEVMTTRCSPQTTRQLNQVKFGSVGRIHQEGVRCDVWRGTE